MNKKRKDFKIIRTKSEKNFNKMEDARFLLLARLNASMLLPPCCNGSCSDVDSSGHFYCLFLSFAYENGEFDETGNEETVDFEIILEFLQETEK